MRIRTIKPEFWMNEKLAGCSEFARLLSIALLNWADDEGYFRANPQLIRGALFPFLDDSKKIPRAIQELSGIGYLMVGSDDDGDQIGKIVKFLNHQRIDKPQKSILKQKAQFQECSKSDQGIVLDDSDSILGGNGKGKGMEREEEKEGESAKIGRKGLANPTLDDVITFCREKGYKYFDCKKYHALRTANNWINSKGRKISNWKNDINTAQAFDNFQRQLTAEEIEYEAMLKLAAECARDVGVMQ